MPGLANPATHRDAASHAPATAAAVSIEAGGAAADTHADTAVYLGAAARGQRRCRQDDQGGQQQARRNQ